MPEALPLRPFATDRLTVRPAGPGDTASVWRYRRLPEVARWLTAEPADEGAFRETFVEPASLAVTLVVEHGGAVIGDLRLAVEDAWGQAEVADRARRTQAELGWVFDPGHHGCGFATEAVAGLIRACFTDLGLRRVTAGCFLDNERSWRLMERVGMRREGLFRADSLHRDGRWLDSCTYGLLRDEWRQGPPAG
ncbi:GNAT family N-acetyltransferase [Actinotalea sp. M2MS4P-6]|uniref:GNAT family N-acetyltransferase n=1 Tax=Actinotalea sp. M2MS4P-6 TaxID=2983762 RepID=UPI0021E38480|nr:GNAT family protein [Actinotalea sp. M2MS4P-6]MCV2394669.1 GNAT family N-acetyltransferase [Actinotalea sp. M2MS4P-6]